MSKEKAIYSDKPLVQRLLFFITGFLNFLVGYTLYYLFKDDKSKEWQAEFLQRGATFGFIFAVISTIVIIVEYIIL